ncbi:MAG TPA: MaoC family dehydratase N-terminal domain-containing protein [Acidimicrobiales bacterium]|nr:MaoC family dehydratase N-terminal domain-containing protein [Acidimicrobiales bacterium]
MRRWARRSRHTARWEGRPMTAEKFPVEAGHIMMFARSVGDENPAYHDPGSPEARQAGGVLAPPTFVQASAQFDPDYPLRPKAGKVWFGSGRTPSGLTEAAAGEPRDGGGGGGGGGGTGLHAEQHYTYHRPLVAGEVLTPTVRPGRTWEKQGRRGGTLQFSESITEYRGADGELVVTARAVGVRTGQVVQS